MVQKMQNYHKVANGLLKSVSDFIAAYLANSVEEFLRLSAGFARA